MLIHGGYENAGGAGRFEVRIKDKIKCRTRSGSALLSTLRIKAKDILILQETAEAKKLCTC